MASIGRPNTGDAELDKVLMEYIRQDQYDQTRAQLQSLLDKNDVEELRALFGSRMTFGTAGLRAAMGVGNSRMNDLTVIQATQGLEAYITKQCGEKQTIVIGYDARHNSKRFATRAATVFLSQGHKVLLFSDIVPTPFVAFSVLHFNCSAGIMVTASHNPKEDNGYKVYWGNGAQIIPPHDKGIAAEIEANLQPRASAWDETVPAKHSDCKDPYDEVMKEYYKAIACNHHELPVDNPVDGAQPPILTYTAMHGVGHKFIDAAFDSFKLPTPVPVKEQVVPDPNFPTVKYPNPEEGKGALELAMKTADSNNSTVIIANDPDADRLAVAVKHQGEWRVLTGNETGALFGWWLWNVYCNENPSADKSKVYMLSSTVSSMVLRTIARAEGFKFEDTLTGFKWLGNRGKQLEAEGNTVLFGFEEAIGFCVGTRVLDKDGVSAAVVMAEMTRHLAQKGMSLVDQLNAIYEKYGYHATNNSYYICKSQPTIDKIFEGIYNDGKYIETVGSHKVVRVRDLGRGLDTTAPEQKATLPKSNNMITFELDNDTIFTLRTSGTEPKIKYYSEIRASGTTPEEKKRVDEELKKVVELLVEKLLQPSKYDLKPRGS